MDHLASSFRRLSLLRSTPLIATDTLRCVNTAEVPPRELTVSSSRLRTLKRLAVLTLLTGTGYSCAGSRSSADGARHGGEPSDSGSGSQPQPEAVRTSDRFAHDPLVSDFYTADPSAHVFDDRLYIYPSHDIDTDMEEDEAGSHFAMRDYHVLSLGKVGEPIIDHGVALDIAAIPWAKQQLWAPDAAEKDGTYFLFFPAKNPEGIFRIGVATSRSPTGPFIPETTPIEGSFSIDPAVFADGDEHYLYFGGIWGGQLQRYKSGKYVATDDTQPPSGSPALSPKMARLAADLRSFAEPVQDVMVLDEGGEPLRSEDHARRFFEAAFVHKHQNTYYLSYSTGNTHFIVYATGASPYGPFTYRGRLLAPVLGWTTHHSVVRFRGRWYLFYHDSQLSGGKPHLRNIKMAPLVHESDGTIRLIQP